ncbi:MAG: Fe-S cluster assembly protein SufD [Bacteroidia bacterium]|nr:Fe-S cluster assembly protein SufD [Bacteroidia bacterium]
MANKIQELEQERTAFIAQFDAGQGIAAVEDQKAIAASALKNLQIPTRKWEEWKYTDLKALVKKEFSPAHESPFTDIQPYLIPNLESDVLVFINGRYREELSSISHNEESLIINDLRNIAGKGKEAFETYFGKAVSPDLDIFAAINTAYAGDGVFIGVPTGKTTAKPIQILHLADNKEQSSTMQHRNMFVVGRNGEAQVVESYHSLADSPTLRNQVTEIFVDANAGLEYVKIQLESGEASSIDRTLVHQARDSRFSIHTITLGGKLVRNNLDIKMDGVNISSELKGLYMLSGTQHVDNHTQVDHMNADGYSNELYKGILKDQSTGVFNGRIHVYQDAQKTNAFQSNNNVLLDDTANIYTKPQLEIYADDVKCSHGATLGSLDEEAMFYLQARGIKKDQARKMLVHSFVMEVADDISMDAVKDFIEEKIENRF